jgi:uncharacterized membrane protein YedE/YeeE
MYFLRLRSWSPYVVGALIGVLSWFTFATADKALGVSTTFVRAAGLAEQAIVPAHVQANAYFVSKGVKVDWQMMLVIGMVAGTFLSAWLSQGLKIERVPDLWKARFGDSVVLRYAMAFVGGLILVFGARLAGGCTSGHGISGALQLALSGWTFFMAVFAAGIATAFTLYGKVRSNV